MDQDIKNIAASLAQLPDRDLGFVLRAMTSGDAAKVKEHHDSHIIQALATRYLNRSNDVSKAHYFTDIRNALCLLVLNGGDPNIALDLKPSVDRGATSRRTLIAAFAGLGKGLFDRVPGFFERASEDARKIFGDNADDLRPLSQHAVDLSYTILTQAALQSDTLLDKNLNHIADIIQLPGAEPPFYVNSQEYVINAQLYGLRSLREILFVPLRENMSAEVLNTVPQRIFDVSDYIAKGCLRKPFKDWDYGASHRRVLNARATENMRFAVELGATPSQEWLDSFRAAVPSIMPGTRGDNKEFVTQAALLLGTLAGKNIGESAQMIEDLRNEEDSDRFVGEAVRKAERIRNGIPSLLLNAQRSVAALMKKNRQEHAPKNA